MTLLAWAIALATIVVWDFGGPFESVAKVGTLIFFLLGLVGLLRFLYAFLFVKDTVESPSQATLPGAASSHTMRGGSTRAVLSSARSVADSDYSPRGKTRELLSQPSVTENTTRLLEERDN